jgi:endoglucanase
MHRNHRAINHLAKTQKEEASMVLTWKTFRTLRVLIPLLLFATAPLLVAQTAFVRVNQAGYEVGTTARAYLMTTAAPAHAKFKVISQSGKTAHSASIGELVGTWAHSSDTSYNVYSLDFSVPAGIYSLAVSGDVTATSPRFAVDTPEALYSGLLLNTLFFYQTERDGADYVQNALRSKPGHLKDEYATRYQTPPLDDNDYINNVPPASPLVKSGLSNMDASGGWWDAGDYEKYVSNISYTAALMQIGVRDFPAQMGAEARHYPAAPPVSASYAGTSGAGAPKSSDFTAEARFGVDWLLKMWDSKTKTLAYQVDNSQEWNYYGWGYPTSTACGGDYPSPYCLITEYDIWTLPQAADNYQQSGDPRPCDVDTTYFICNRPVFTTLPAQTTLCPNLAGRLAADFALCATLERNHDPNRANRCLANAETIYAMADLTFTDPAPSPGDGSCANCLLTSTPPNAETVWDDDMELGATELYFALSAANSSGHAPAGLPQTDPLVYLKQATQFAKNYTNNIYPYGYGDTLNLYDVSGLAHFELYRAIAAAGNPKGLAMSRTALRKQLLTQVDAAISQATSDAWQFGEEWDNGDVTSHGAGLSVMASEAYSLTGSEKYNQYAQRWLGNILGANAWGSSFIVGAGTTFPNCIQHQVANLAGSLSGTAGGTPILWGASVEGPSNDTSSGTLSGMNLCPADGSDAFEVFNGNSGAYDDSIYTYYQDNVQSYTTTEPAIDLTASSFLMWSWRMAGEPSF